METTPPVDTLDKFLRFVCLRWVTNDELVHSVWRKDSFQMETYLLVVEVWYGLESFQSIDGMVQVSTEQHLRYSDFQPTALEKTSFLYQLIL